MTLLLTYRTTDPGGQWTGTGADLSASTIDGNFYALQSAVNGLLASSGSAVGISTITQPSPSTWQVTLTNAVVLGPFSLPVAVLNPRGTWAPSTAYNVDDLFTENGAAYIVLVAHTSALTFSASATDGSGHQLYGLWFTFPADVLPAGGAVSAILAKNTTADFDVGWIMPALTAATGGNIAITGAWPTLSFSFSGVLPVVNGGTGLSALGTGVAAALGNSANGAGGFLTTVNLATNVGATILPVANGGTGTATPALVAGANIAITGTWPDQTIAYHITVAAFSATTGAVALDATTGDIFTVTPTGALTVTASTTPAKRITIKVVTSGTTSYGVTFSTNFKSQGVLNTGTVSGATFIIDFIGDGTAFYEVSRTAAM